MPDTPARLEYPILAVGDLHGQLGPLDRLLARLTQLPEWPAASVVFVGDFVDRGPDVKGTVQRVMDLLAEKPGACVLGNHDLAFLSATGIGGRPSDYWRRRYGEYGDHEATFQSYLGRAPEYHGFDDWLSDLAALRAAVPADHQRFLAGLPWVAEAAGHVFLHNGLSPELLEAADIQLELLRRRLWAGYVSPRPGTKTGAEYRPEYPVWLGADKRLSADPLPLPGRVQVTGHKRVEAPDVNPVRVRIDTTGGLGGELVGCLLRGPGVPPEFVGGE